jgi:hypothetical protein
MPKFNHWRPPATDRANLKDETLRITIRRRQSPQVQANIGQHSHDNHTADQRLNRQSAAVIITPG